MISTEPTKAPAGSGRATVVVALVAIAVLVLGVLIHRAWASSPLSSFSASSFSMSSPDDSRRDTRTGAMDEDDGTLPDGVTVFDERHAGVTRLDPELLKALRHAAPEAAQDGVTLVVNSGWRSAGYQNQLLQQAVAKYGSPDEAARWVATPDTSPHVSGDAVDVGPSAAAAWLGRHGAAYGLCRIYQNEPWHFELRPDAVRHGCPSRYADPTEDPRLQD